jgi:hypothetical protein
MYVKVVLMFYGLFLRIAYSDGKEYILNMLELLLLTGKFYGMRWRRAVGANLFPPVVSEIVINPRSPRNFIKLDP